MASKQISAVIPIYAIGITLSEYGNPVTPYPFVGLPGRLLV